MTFKIILPLFILILISEKLFSQDSVSQKTNGPYLTFYSETVRTEDGKTKFSTGNQLNVGKIKNYWEAGYQIRKIKFKNTGNEPLVISNVTTACGCDVPSWDKSKTYKPGETGEIQYWYDTKRNGPFNKTMTVSSNAINSSAPYGITGEVIQGAIQENDFAEKKGIPFVK